MFDIATGQFILDNPILWIDLAISFVVVFTMLIIMSRFFKSITVRIIMWVSFVALFASWFFGLTFLWAINIAAFGALMAIVFIGDAKPLLKMGLVSLRKKSTPERIYNRELVCQKVAIAVENLSRTKTGALITFEMEDKFNDIVKSGTLIESPISPELLATIFYPGTRLHDGAVVIRRDEILAASVYYSPTTKPLTGKYGSRHRAGIGISETTDSVTIIVSEETGRISIAYKGELVPVSQDRFLTTLQEYLMGERD